jgi:hypothetical protein
MRVAVVSLALAWGLVAGCDRGGKPQTFGAPLAAGPVVTLADLASKRAAYRNQTVTSAGEVTFVCQEKGCFMEVEDNGVSANVRVHDHAFSFPKGSAGRKARFTGRVTYLWEGKETDDQHLAESMIELDTIGAELRE